jgi:putative transposase
METYRISDEASVYYVTYSIVDWLPVFVSESACRIVTDCFVHCQQHKGLCVNAYVIMPTHLHAIVFEHEHDSTRLATTLDEFRRFTGRSLCDFCAAHMPSVFSDSFRAAATNDRKRRFWQATRHPVAVHGIEFWKTKLDYLHANPCRKGLVLYPEDWRFSSARYYANPAENGGDVLITQFAWH